MQPVSVRPTWSTYLWYAAFSLRHGVTLFAMLVVGAALTRDWGVWQTLAALTVTLVLDGLVVVAFSRLRWFRRRVGRRLAAIAREVAAMDRQAVLHCMGTRHRLEFLHLEEVVTAIRHLLRARGAPVATTLDPCATLLATYVRLAIRHRRATDCLSAFDTEAVGNSIADLERAKQASPESVRPHVGKRLAACRQRARMSALTRERLKTLEDQLSMIRERILLAHEDSSAARPSDAEGGLWRVATLDEEEMR